MISVCETCFDPAEELGAFEKKTDDAGAVVSFLGKVRGKSGNNDIRGLQLEHYPGVTEKSIAAIEREAQRRWAIDDTLIIHRVGAIKPGEPIVLVCVSAAHRRDAFEAADFLMDFLKTKAMFWKKEIRTDGDSWIDPREGDYKDAKRWQWEE